MAVTITEASCQSNHDALIKTIDGRIQNCKGDIASELHTMNDTLSAFSSAFPHTEDGKPDFGGHRSYHDMLISAARAEEKFWTDLRHELLKKGIVWGLFVVLGLIVVGIQVKLGIIKVMS